jgi:hypothetical protein
VGVSWDTDGTVLWDDAAEMAATRAWVEENSQLDRYGRDTSDPSGDYERAEAAVAGIDDYLVHKGRVVGFQEAAKLANWSVVDDLESGDREKQRRALTLSLEANGEFGSRSYLDLVARETAERIGADRVNALLEQSSQTALQAAVPKQGIFSSHGSSAQEAAARRAAGEAAALARTRLRREAEAAARANATTRVDSSRVAPAPPVRRQPANMRMAGDALPAIGDAYNELRAISRSVADGVALQPGQSSINAGLLTEAMLASPMAERLIQLEDDKLRGALAMGLSAPAGAPNSSMIKEALSLYGRPDGLIAHYRHGAASPATFTDNGMLVYAPGEGSNLYRVQNSSATRYLADGYRGMQRAGAEEMSYRDLVNAIKFRENKGWYSNFVDPGVSESKPLPRLPYQGGNNLEGWEEHILQNGSPEDIARMKAIQAGRRR